jgi:hypothetical protein
LPHLVQTSTSESRAPLRPTDSDRSADATLPSYPRSSSFLGALSLVLAPARWQPTAQTPDPTHQRWRASVCVGAGAALFREPGSVHTQLAKHGPHPYLTHSLLSLGPRSFGTHTYLGSFPSPPPAPFCLPLVPTHHTRLDATPSSPLSFPLASSQPYASLTYTCAYDCMLFPSPISLHTYISAANPISNTSNEYIVFFVRLSSCLNAPHHRQRLQSIQFN